VIDHYAAGGRTIVSGPNAGVGADSPLKSELMVGFRITETEKADVVAFLRSLTDEELLKNPKLADPWPNEPNP
jgi:cytochrome c peroxidase